MRRENLKVSLRTLTFGENVDCGDSYHMHQLDTEPNRTPRKVNELNLMRRNYEHGIILELNISRCFLCKLVLTPRPSNELCEQIWVAHDYF